MKFIINKDELTVDDKEEIFNSGSVNYYEAEVEFDESWNGLTVEAKIVPKEGAYYDDEGKSIAVINNRVYIDNKLSGSYGIGFVGYRVDNNAKVYQISTNLQCIWFNKGAGEIETSEEDVPTPSQWEIYIAQIQEMLDNIETVPAGGTTGQVLAKKSNADGDVEWQDVQGGGSGNHSELDNLDYEHSGHTGFQPTLESGTNIKTINNQSILGEGNIEIAGVPEDNLTITKNNQQRLQAVGIIDSNAGNVDKIWVGTKQQYDAIQEKDNNTLYHITDDDNQIIDIRVNGTSVVDENGIANIAVPAEVTETTVANWGFTKNTGTYSKPSGGIPKTDLDSAVQTSLGKADTAVQPEVGKGLFSGSYNDLTNKPTIPDELSDLNDDSTHRLVTDTEKTTWNNKSDFSGDYNDLINKPTILPSTWGTITGTLSDQTDLQSALDSKLTLPAENVTYYVSPSGNDTNDGLTTNTRFKTIQHAIDLIPTVMNGKTYKIMLANGTYNEDLLIQNKLGGTVAIWGDKELYGTNQANDITISSIDVSVCSNVAIQYMDLILNRTNGTSLLVSRPSYIIFYRCEKVTINNNTNKTNTGIQTQQGATLVAVVAPFYINYTNEAIISQTNGYVGIDVATINNSITGINSRSGGRVSFVTLTNNATTKATTSSGGRLLLGGNADTTNWRY